jgi:large subunit ribosomal protein L2
MERLVNSGLKAWKPTSPGQRGRVTVDRYNLYRGRPFKPLTTGGVHHTGGRNHTGRTTVWHKGGGHKRLYRLIDFRRALQAESVVERVEYDPNRTARIALVRHLGERFEGMPAPLSHSTRR